MDGINAISQKTDRNTVAGGSDEFRSVADGFAALLQLSGKSVKGDDAVKTLEGELMRYDDKRDLVRDSHKLNDADTHADDVEDVDEVEEPDADADTRQADDEGDESGDEDGGQETASENSDDNANGEGQGEQTAQSGENANQPDVTGEAVTAALGLVEGAAAANAAAQAKAATETAGPQVQTVQATQVKAAVDTNAGQTNAQQQQAAVQGAQQVAQGQTDQSDKVFKPAETQAGPAVAAAATAQSAATQQTAAQAQQALQSAPGQQIAQDRAQGQQGELRSAQAQAQSQDLSQRLGDDNRIRVQVNVTGPQTNQGPVEPGQFNRFVGYNAADMRVASLANGQTGTGIVNAASVATPDTPAEKPASQTTAPIPSSAAQPHTQASQLGAQTQPGIARAADLAGTPGRGDGALAQSNTGSTGTSGNAAPAAQPAQAGAVQSGQSFAQTVQQTASAERPPAPSSSQVIEQIKVNINRSVKAGMDRVTIQLRPESLGRIEVKMELSQDGKVRAFVTVESRETLDLLQRDARGLERALQDAGLRTDSNNLHFALKSEAQDHNGKNQSAENGGASANDNDGEAEALAEDEAVYDRALAAAQRGGVDALV